ncbi:MAG: nuclear transport factor 2 family protein [Bacteroidota bacterium]
MSSPENNTQRVLDYYDRVLQRGEITQLDQYFHPHFIQHHPQIDPGLEGLSTYLRVSGQWTHHIHRQLVDGDWVALHSEARSEAFPPSAAWGLYRLVDGKIVEYWHNLQPLPQKSVSGRSPLDGPRTVADREQTAENKALVERFYRNVIVAGNFAAVDPYFDGDRYWQHNALLPDGVAGFRKTMQAMALTGMGIQIQKVHLILGEGNFVLVLAEGTMVGKSYWTYDLFRVEQGKIVEHWDVMAEIPNRGARQ